MMTEPLSKCCLAPCMVIATMYLSGNRVRGAYSGKWSLYVCTACGSLVMDAYQLNLCDASCEMFLTSAPRLYLVDPDVYEQTGIGLTNARGEPVDHDRYRWILMPVGPEYACYICQCLRTMRGANPRCIVCTCSGKYGVMMYEAGKECTANDGKRVLFGQHV